MATRTKKKTTNTTSTRTSDQTPTTSRTSVVVRRDNSPSPMNLKEQLQELNDRLAAYIDRVDYLENENARLEDQITVTEENANRKVRAVKDTYDRKLDEARRPLDEANKERAQALLDADRYRTEAGDWQTKYLNRDRDAKAAEKKVLDLEAELGDLSARLNAAENAKKQAEKEQARLRGEAAELSRQLRELQKKLENVTALRVDYENRCQYLEDELEWRQKTHEDELASALGQEKELYDRYRDELKAQYDAKFQDMLDALRAEHDAQLRQIRLEFEERYNTRDPGLEGRVRELEALLVQYEADLARKDAEADQLRRDLEARTRDYLELVEVKLKLEAEVNMYRQLLDWGEKWLETKESPEFKKSTGKSPLHTSRKTVAGSPPRKRTAAISPLSEEDAETPVSTRTTNRSPVSKRMRSGSPASKRTTSGSPVSLRMTTKSPVSRRVTDIIPEEDEDLQSVSQTSTGRPITPISQSKSKASSSITSSTSPEKTPSKGGSLQNVSRGLKRKLVFSDGDQEEVEDGDNMYSTESLSAGAVEINHTDFDGRFIQIFNKADQDIPLGGWVLKQTTADEETAYEFPQNFQLKARQFCTVWSSTAHQAHNPPTDIVMKNQQWFAGDNMRTELIHNGVEQASREQTKRRSL